VHKFNQDIELKSEIENLNLILGNAKMSSRAIVIVIALIIVGFTLVSMRDYFMHEPAAQAPEPAVQRILVAKRNLASGTFVQAQQDFDWQPAPEAAAKSGDTAGEKAGDAPEANTNYLYEGVARPEDFNGAVVRRPIHAGEAIIPSMLMKSGEGGFMSAVLEPGKRAVSISVNLTSGNAGFVSPGDRVDLLVTYRVKNAKNVDSGSGESIGTETFAHNVRVLAVDQTLDNPENKAIIAKTITVEVTPEEAEKISVASEMGKISVALVSVGTEPTSDAKDTATQEPADKNPGNNVKTPGNPSDSQNYTLDGDVSSLIAKREGATSKVRVIRGDKIETLEFYQDKQ
jgi:pilus assembly protein CpaB